MNSNGRKELKRLACVAGLFFLVYLLVWVLLPDVTKVGEYFRELGPRGRWLFLGAAALAASVSAPRQFIALAAGIIFGWLEGVVICSMAIMLGNAAQFTISRLFLRPFLHRRYPERMDYFNRLIGLGPFRMVMMLRLLPAGNSGLINLAGGASKISPFLFLGASYLGQMPQTIIFTLAGSGLNVDPVLRISVAAVLFAVSIFIGVGLYRRYRLLLPTIKQNH